MQNCDELREERSLYKATEWSTNTAVSDPFAFRKNHFVALPILSRVTRALYATPATAAQVSFKGNQHMLLMRIESLILSHTRSKETSLALGAQSPEPECFLTLGTWKN